MTFIEAILLSLALCVDSLVVSATTAFHSRIDYRRGVLMAFIFGLCQGVFPLAGALIGDVAHSFIEAIDHWVAFVLLAFVGGKMLSDGIKGKKNASKPKRINISTMFLLGIATSIDALAVGIGLGLQHTMSTVLWIVAVIGVVTTLVSLIGVILGNRNIKIPARTASIIAGIVLICIGIKILLEHLF